MTSSNPDEPLARRLTTSRSLRHLEAATHLFTAAAFMLTVLLVSTGRASEANIVTAELLSTAGWTATGLLAIATATATFAYLHRHRRTAPRAVAVGAVLLVTIGFADLAINGWTLWQVGIPESIWWAKYAAPVALVGGAGVLAAGRHHVSAVARAAAPTTRAPTPQQTAAIAFVLILVISGVGPFASFGGLVATDHNGTATAISESQTETAWTADYNGISDIYTDGDDQYIWVAGDVTIDGNETRVVDKRDAQTGELLQRSDEIASTVASDSPNRLASGPNSNTIYWYGNGSVRDVGEFRKDDLSVVWSTNEGSDISSPPDTELVYNENDGKAYYLYAGSGYADLYQIDGATQSASLVTSTSTSGSTLALHDNVLYWGWFDQQSGTTYNLTSDSTGSWSSPSDTTVTMRSDGQYMYIPDYNSDGLYKWNPDTGSTVTQGTFSGLSPTEGRLHNDTVFWMGNNKETIHGFSTTDFGHTYNVTASGSFSVRAFAAGENAVFAADGSTLKAYTTSDGFGGPTGPTGRALDQNGDPVANATVVATYDGPNVSEKTVDGTPYQEIEDDPTTNLDDWQAQMDDLGVEVPSAATPSDWEDALAEQSDARVVAHPHEDWDLQEYEVVLPGGAGVNYRRITIELDRVDLSEPQLVYEAGQPIVLSCWDGTGMSLTEDHIDQSLPGETESCSVTVEEVDPLGDTESTTTYESEPLIDARTFQNPTSKKHHGIVLDDLDKGVYRVTHNESGQTTVLAVSPDGEFETLTAEIENWGSQNEQWATEFNQRMADIYGDLPAETTTTNETGHFTLDPPAGADSVTLTATKSGAEAVINDPINVSKKSLQEDIETATRAEFNDEVQGVDFDVAYDARNTDDTFRRACERMGSVAEQTGAPYYGDKRNVPVSGGNFDVTGERILTKGLDPAAQTCAAINFADQIAENGLGGVFAGLPDDLSDLTDAELEELVAPWLDLFQANPILKDEVEDRTGVTLDSDTPADYSRGDLENLADDGVSVIDDGTSDIPTGGNTGGGGIPTGGDDPPNVGDGTGSVDETAETLSQSWPVANVDDWDQAALVIRITNGQGETVATLSQDSEYVSVDEGPGADTVELTDYPINGSAKAFGLEIDVVTPDGAGDNTAPPVAGPGLNGQLPDTEHIRVSSLSPAAGESVSISAGGGPAFGNVEHVNVTSPDGTTTQYTATDGEANIKMGSAGDHRVAIAMSNAEGETVTEVLTVTAGTTSQGRPATIIADSGVTGRFAVVGNGFERGSIETADGNSEVRFVGVYSGEPGPVSVHATGISAASDTTYSVELRKGADERAIDASPEVLLHMPTADDSAIYWRNGRAIPKGEQGTEGTVQHRNESSVAETFYDADAGLRVRAVEDPGFIQSTQHWIDRNIPTMPFSLGVGAVGLAVLPAGAVVGRRYL